MVQITGAPRKFSPPVKTGLSKAVATLLAALFLMTSQPLDGKTASKADENSALDAAYQALKSLHNKKPDSLYSTMLQTGQESADLYWKLARLNISIAESIDPAEREKRIPFYNKSVEYARRSVQLDSNNASAHTWLAASLALKADKIGSKEKLNRAAEIKRELDKALALNPNDDVAWSMLGSYNFEASKIGWFSRFMGGTFVGQMPKGSREEAEKDFKKAISLNPRVISHYH
jgi:tetratricopeptide (TPR) repeat protein